jgi:hydroxymethylpyrimidine kinase/phosphomethylpyrimidine kinase/thiamine-phosphate diphosphorylase
METPKPPVVLAVGGSDPSAHAGLQVDLRVANDLGAHCVTITSALTAQNSLRLLDVQAVDIDMFHRQWEAVLEDVTPQVIKIGVLPSPELVEATANWIQRCRKRVPDLRMLLDPVAFATTGGALQQSGCWPAMQQHLLPVVDWILPNLDELKQMIVFQSSDHDSVYSAFENWVEKQIDLNCQWLIKGGHAEGSSSCDYWFNPQQGQQSWLGFDSPRQEQSNNRGTGCTLSSAFAIFLAHGYDDADSLTLAKAYLNSALQNAYQVGSGPGPLGVTGWPAHHSQLPRIQLGRLSLHQRYQGIKPF